MEAFSIARISKRKAPVPSTERAFHGRLCERAALAYCRRRGYRVVTRNLRVSMGEIDLVAEARDGTLVLLEVRGKRSGAFRPVHTLSHEKRRRLEKLAIWLSLRARRPVRIELVQVMGNGPRRQRRAWLWLARFRPEWLGLGLEAFRVEG